MSAHIQSCSTNYLEQNECLKAKFGAVDQLQLSLVDNDRLKTPRKCSVSTHFEPLTVYETVKTLSYLVLQCSLKSFGPCYSRPDAHYPVCMLLSLIYSKLECI